MSPAFVYLFGLLYEHTLCRLRFGHFLKSCVPFILFWFAQVEPHTGKKTVLVTGGAGFIGSWVADALLARGDDVVIVDEVGEDRGRVGLLMVGVGCWVP